MSVAGWLRLQRQQRACLDPDKQVQESLRFFFETFRRTASACAVVKTFRRKGLLFPRRLKKGPNKGDLVWAELPHSRTLHILHNPRYAGAFVYGRSRTRNSPNGGTSYTRLPREQWMLLKNAHAGYISWEQYEENLRRLHEKCASRRSRPPQEPSARRPSIAARVGGLWKMRKPDDGSISRTPGAPRARVRLPARRH